MNVHEIDRLLARLAARQHGLLTRLQALAAGATDEMIAHRLSTGRWVRVAAGVYRLAGVPVTWRQRALAAVLAAGPGAVVSHRSAAVLHAISGFRPGPLHVTVPAGRSGRNPLATVHRTVDLPARHTTRRDRIPVTSVARTVADLARTVPPDLLEEAVDDVLCRRLVTFEALQPHRRGALRTILAAWRPDDHPDTPPEVRLARALVAHGLPRPEFQHEVFANGELVARIDVAYPDHRIAIELDSFRWHAGRRPFCSDRARRNRVEALGWHVLQATPEDVMPGAATPFYSAARALLRRVA
jgi:hypothetical protein